MEFFEFVNRLYPIVGGDRSKDVFAQDLFLNMTDGEDAGSTIEEMQLSTYRSYCSGERSISRLARKIRKDLEPFIFEEYIKELNDELSVSICEAFFDDIPDINEYNVGEKLSELFKNIICSAAEQKRKPKKKSNQTKQTSVNNKSNDSVVLEELSENAKDEARRFSIEHESEREFFALCQVACTLNPMHNHVRKLYTDYNMCSHDTRNAILIMNDIPVLFFEDDWECKYLELFREDIRKQHLMQGIDLLYEGGKYLQKAMEYPENHVSDLYKYAFPTIGGNKNQNKRGKLVDFIDQYVYKNENLTFGYGGEPPLQWMINAFDLTNAENCPENQLAIWLNLFVYSACYVIPRNYNRRDPADLSFLAPDTEEIETLEDLYYSALLNLHSIYSQD